MARRRLTLTRWTWRAFISTTLGPLLLVELVLLAAYGTMVLHNYVTSVDALDRIARAQVRDRVAAESASVRVTLAGIEREVALLAAEAGRALRNDAALPAEELARYSHTAEGAYVVADPAPGGATVFYSGAAPIDVDKAHRTGRMDPFMRDLVVADPLVAQAYLNTWDSLNRIHPPIDVADYPPRMDIPSFNFYYLADEAHNPERKVVWTDAYLDPAGAGWITSAVGPVYEGDHLEGVVGVDVTLQQLVDQVLDVDLPWGGYAVLVDSHGALLALPEAGEADFGIRELTSHEYTGAVATDTLKPADYDLFHRPSTRELGQHLASADRGLAETSLGGSRLVAWERLDGPGWWLVVVVPKDAIFASADEAWADSLRLGAIVIGAILMFYAAFLALLYWRVRGQLDLVVQPIQALRDAVRDIAAGRHQQPAVQAEIVELGELCDDVLAMGRTLGVQVEQLQSQDDELRAASEREAAARAAAEARSSFLAHVSHEIRTPMNGLVGTLQLLSVDGLDEEGVELIGTARRSADALLGLIDDLLEATRTQRGTFEIEDDPFDLESLALDVLALFRPTAEGAGIALVGEVEVESSWARGDALRIRQVLTNLVSNALKFTERGEVRLTALRDGDLVAFAVRDSGIGIPPGRLEAIFDAFTQADASTTRRFGGTGLGLTISAALVRRMGGELIVESEEGVGSTFHFTVPLPVTTAPAQGLPAAIEGADRRSLRILVAEDHEVNRAIIQRMLARLGHESVVVENGAEAVEAAAGGGFDVVLLDVHMPVMDGRAAARALRAGADTAGLPLLALTASVLEQDVRDSLAAGFDQVLAKPIVLEVLDEALARAASCTRVSTDHWSSAWRP